MPEKGSFEKKNSSLIILSSSLLFIFSSPKQNLSKISQQHIFAMGPCLFFSPTLVLLLSLPPQYPLEHVTGLMQAFKYAFEGP